jgi:hypothetical protein
MSTAVAASDAPSRRTHNGLIEPDRIYGFDLCADLADISLPTFRRQVKKGTGPQVTQVSDRRFGVRGRHLSAWLDSKALADEAGAAGQAQRCGQAPERA